MADITAEKAKETYEKLLAEKQEIENKIAEAEALKQRLRELNGGWSTLGELEKAKLQLRDVRFPIYETVAFDTKRIVGVDSKWIYLRNDGSIIQPKRYKKSTGWPERSRDGYGKIDAQKAIDIWEAHNG